MMKKTLTLLVLSAVLLTALTGCSSSSENNSVEVSENSSVSDESNVSSVNNSNVVAGQSTLTVYVLEVSEGSIKGETLPEEEGSDEIAKTVTVYNDNIHTEDIAKGMVVMITYTGELSQNGEEYTVNADSFEAL